MMDEVTNIDDDNIKKKQLIIIMVIIIMMVIMLTLNDDDDRNRQHILGIGRHQQLLHERGRQDLCTQCIHLLDSIDTCFFIITCSEATHNACIHLFTFTLVPEQCQLLA